MMIKVLRMKDKEELIEIIKKLSSTKKYGLLWDEERTKEQFEVDIQNNIPVLKEVKDKEIITDITKPTNIIIEGDNYHSLSILNYTHQGKIDVIYIDPPYNTGAKDWKYNNNYVDSEDTWRHSKWLSFMNKRLKLAKNLLKNDGVIICAIDENELHHLGILLEEIFGGYEIHCITIVHNPRGVQGKNFSYTNEFAFFIFKKGLKVIGSRKIDEKNIDWRGLRDSGKESMRSDARNCFYPIIINNNNQIVGFGDVLDANISPLNQTEEHDGNFYIWPIDIKGFEKKWRYARQSIDSIKNLLRVKKIKRGYDIEIGKNFGTVRTVWQDSKYDASEYGTKLLQDILSSTSFNFPKSIYNVYDCISPIISNRDNAIILDFFAGSGTTGHAVLELNKEDGGNRQFILCTNNENKICEEVTYPRIQKVIGGYDKLNGEHIDGLGGNLKYYKTDFVEKSLVSDDLKDRLIKSGWIL